MNSCRAALWVGLVSGLASVLAVGCNSSAKAPAGQCNSGICGTSSAGTGAAGSTAGTQGGSGSSAAGTNGGSGAGARGGTSGGGTSGGGTSGGGTSGGGTSGAGTGGSGGSAGTGGGASCSPGAACVESWLCTPWSTNGSNDSGTRTCTDQCNCGTTAHKPVETATLPALNVGYYQCSVEPVFDKFCAMLGCHGTEAGRAFRVYARGRLRVTGDTLTGIQNCDAVASKPSQDCTAGIECACDQDPHTMNEWRKNYDAARGLLLGDNGTALSNVEDCGLLKQPLVGGGLAHAGIHIFQKTDAGYTAIKDWLNGTANNSCASTN